MSRDMSEEQEASNPFETLSDDPILHIFSYLPGADLLKLSGMDKTFNRIITESRETMSKIRLVLSFDEDDVTLDLDYAIELAQTRRFTALKLSGIYAIDDAHVKVKLALLLEMLSDSVDDLFVCGGILQGLLPSIALFLSGLKKCKLDFASFDIEARAPSSSSSSSSSYDDGDDDDDDDDDDGGAALEEISSRSIANHPLESLELNDTRAEDVLQFFSGCNQLKTFRYEDLNVTAYEDEDDIKIVNNFLAKQDRLEKLIVESKGLAWDRLKCFKLKELTVDGVYDGLDAAEFLKKLPDLTKLGIGVCYDYSGRRQLMKAICGIPKLEDLTIQSWYDEGDDEDTLERLMNHTVKELEIVDATRITAKLLKVFLAVESIYLSVKTDVLDLSDVSFETIEKIVHHDSQRINRGDIKKFLVKFSPSAIPANVKQFELAVFKFTFRFSSFISGIEIGHESWRNSGAFRLSNLICEFIVNHLPKLRKLEIYNVADRGRFKKFLVENQARLNLKGFKLHEPFGVCETCGCKPKKKKMKF